METLKLNTRLKTPEAEVALDPGLPPGRYQLTLVVSGARGDSLPAELLLTVLDARGPGLPHGIAAPGAAPKARPRGPRPAK